MWAGGRVRDNSDAARVGRGRDQAHHGELSVACSSHPLLEEGGICGRLEDESEALDGAVALVDGWSYPGYRERS